ncbi:MAG: aminoacyl-tRNA hydrolase [Candidatus Paceibacterota bacterium]
MKNHFKLEKIKIIIGIGNPGNKYEKTYHNVGLDFMDFIKKYDLSTKIYKSDCFMNKSGLCVKDVINKNGIKSKEVLIVQDDTDIEIGNFKISFDRNSAGHNGIKSIIQELGTKEFWRLRIGIRKEDEAYRSKAKNFVLNKINKDDEQVINETFIDIIEKLQE